MRPHCPPRPPPWSGCRPARRPGSGWRSSTPRTAEALNTAAKARISWLVRDEGAPTALEAVRAAELPEGTPYVWIAGESSQVRALRRHLVQERRFDRRRLTFAGYWRRGLSEEQVREAATGSDA